MELDHTLILDRMNWLAEKGGPIIVVIAALSVLAITMFVPATARNEATTEPAEERASDQTVPEAARHTTAPETPEHTDGTAPAPSAAFEPTPGAVIAAAETDPSVERLLRFKPRKKPPPPKHRPASPTKTKRTPSKPSATGTTKRHTGAPDPGVLKNYSATLRRWVARHKQYPNAARRKKLQGAVRLWIRINRNGVVIASRVTRASGVALLDKATESLPRRASPFPPIPSGVKRDTFSFSVTLRYSIR